MKTPNLTPLRRHVRTLLLLAALFCNLFPARAGVHVWAGGDYLWSKPGNWMSGGAPQLGEAAPIVIVLPPAGAKFSTNDIPGLKIDQLVITGNNYNLGTRNGAAFEFRGEDVAGSPMDGIFITNLTARIHGPLLLNNQCRFQGEGSTLTLNGAIAGTGSLYLTGPNVEFTGTQTNTFNGHLFVQRNELRLNKTNAVAISGPVYIGLDHHNPDAVRVRHLRPDQIANTADVTVYSDGLLDLNGSNDAVQDLTFYGGHVTTGAGTLFLGGNLTAHASDSPAVIDGQLSLGLGQRVVRVEDGAAFDDLQIKGAVSGIAGVTKTGAGLLTFSGPNTFSSTLTIVEGPVLAQSAGALGSSLGHTVVGTNGTLLLFSATYTSETLNLSGHGWQGLGAVHLLEGLSATWAGPVILSTNATFQVNSNSLLEISGAISGPGGLTLEGGGQLLLSGTTANSYGGTCRVHGSNLRLGKTGVLAVPGPLAIGGPIASNAPAARVEFANQQQLHSNAPVSVAVHSLLDLKGFNQTVGPIEMIHGGEIETGAGILTLNGDIVVKVAPTNLISPVSSSPAYASRIRGRLNLGGQPRILTVGDAEVDDTLYDFDGHLRIEASIAGSSSASMTKQGIGQLSLAGTNTYAGLSLFAEGDVLAETSSALGSSAAGTILSNHTYLTLGYGVIIANEPLVMRDGWMWSLWQSVAGTVAWNGPVFLETTGYFSGENLFIGGAISGPGKAVIATADNVRFTGAAPNTYTGGTEVWGGALDLAKPAGVNAVPGPLTIGDGQGAVSSAAVLLLANEQIPDLAPVTVNADGALDLNSYRETVGSLAGSGRVFCHANFLTVGANHQDTIWSGGILGHGLGTLVKQGTGTLQITSDNYYTGQTVVQGGTLDVRGSLADSQVTVVSSGQLIGTGTIGRLSNINGGQTSPGASVGTLHSRDVTMSIPAVFRVELTGLPPSGTSDRLNVNGTVDLGGATLVVVPTNSLPVGTSFVIVENDGSDEVTATFNGLPEGAEFVANQQRFRISYAGGDGNDVVLTRANTAPSMTSLSVSSFAPEGSLVGLDGVISDPDSTDAFKLVVEWGDGSAPQTFNFAAGTTAFHVDHFYADDKPGAQPSDSFTISYTLTDSAGSPALGNLNTVIDNVAPSFPSFGAIGLKSGESLATALTFNDPGSDTWTATVNYGDGTGAQPVTVGANRSLPLSHAFPTNGLYTVTVTVSDDDTGTASTTVQVVVGLELAIAKRSATHVTLSWPGTFVGFNLQTASSVGGGTNWIAAPGAPTLLNGRWTLTVPAADSAAFFRLSGANNL